MQSEVAFIKHDATNTFQKYSYASAGNVLYKINESLSKRGIWCTALVSEVTVTDAAKGKHATCKVQVQFRYGEAIAYADGYGEGSDSGDKAVMKAQTAAHKYALRHAFCLGWGAEDPEASEPAEDAKPTRTPSPKATTQAAPTRPTSTILDKVRELTLTVEAHGIVDEIVRLNKETGGGLKAASADTKKAIIGLIREAYDNDKAQDVVDALRTLA